MPGSLPYTKRIMVRGRLILAGSTWGPILYQKVLFSTWHWGLRLPTMEQAKGYTWKGDEWKDCAG